MFITKSPRYSFGMMGLFLQKQTNYQTIHAYNTSRIYTALKQAPQAFARQYAVLKSSEGVP